MSHCVGHEQCPACADLGKDRSGNNLARYSDGSCFCFSCGYFETANGLSKLKETISFPSPIRGIKLIRNEIR